MSTSWCVFSSREAVPDEGGIILCTTFVQGSALADLQEQFGRSINRSYLKPLTTTVITAKSLLCKYILEDFKLYLSMPCLPFYCLEKNFSRKSQLSSYTESIKVLFRSEGKRRKKQREEENEIFEKQNQLLTLFSEKVSELYVHSATSLFFNFYFYFILLYNTVLVLPYIDINPPRVYMCSQT